MDVGQKKEADAEELQAAVDELRARLRAEEARHVEELRQFAYAVSHDLREPLRMVTSYTQMLKRRYAEHLDDDGREFVRFIVESIQRMEQLLADLLTYSHQFRPVDEPAKLIDPDVVLQAVLLTMDREIQAAGAQITHGPLPKIMSHFERLSQLFRQLIANSLKFRGPEPPRIHISATAGENEVVFSVRDNGIGIDPRYHEQIFGVFRRLHGRECPGTGIGLAISKRIVEQQGGKIWVESESGQGAAFHFSLPR